MSLAKRTLLILSLTAACQAGVLCIAARIILLRQFQGLERDAVQHSMERAHNALTDKLHDLAKTANDYGAWDTTYDFMANPASGTIQREFKDQTLLGLSVNSVLLMEPSGNIVYFKYYDNVHRQEVKLADEIRGALSSSPWVQEVESSYAPNSGIVLLPRGPALIAACPILTSERSGPARGVLVMTRDLNQSFIDHLREQTRSSLSLEVVSNPELARDFLEAKRSWDQEHRSVILQQWSSTIAAGYQVLPDVAGRPAIMLRVDMSRAIFQQGVSSLQYFTAVLGLLTLLFIAVTLLLLRRTVLVRLTSLNAEISQIGEQRKLSARVSVRGRDELAKLRETVNTMLQAIQQGDAEFHQIARNIRQVLWVREQITQKLTYVSPPWKEKQGVTRESLYSDAIVWLQSVHPDDRVLVEDMRSRQRQGEKGEAEFRILLADGSLGWVWCRYFPVFNTAGRLTEMVGLAEDMTEYKHAEETLLRSQEHLWSVMIAATTAV
jgi:PAS domain S-box-containing protein